VTHLPVVDAMDDNYTREVEVSDSLRRGELALMRDLRFE
jgi:hypothetical protein